MDTKNTPTANYASGDDRDTIEANRVYREALAKLTESLDTRKNRFFDPVMLAAAQGFAAPTQTGGFGESFGNAAKNIGAAQELESKKDQEIAQQRVNVAGQGVELQRRRARDADIAKFLTGDQPASPVVGPLPSPVAGPKAAPNASTGPLPTKISTTNEPPAPPVAAMAAPVKPPRVVSSGALPAAAPPTVVAQAPQGGLPDSKNRGNNRGIQISPPIEGSIATLREYVQLNRNSGKSLFDLKQEWQEIQRKNLEVKDSFVYDKASGVMNPTKALPVEIQIYGPGYNSNTYKVSESNALRLSQLLEEKKYDEYTAFADLITGKNFGQSAVSKPATGGSAPVTGGSVEERAIDLERKKKLAEAETAAEIESRKDFTQRSKDASESLAIANVMRSFTKDPNFKKMTGILSDQKVSSGLALLVRDGIGSKNFSVGIPAIEDVMRNAGLSTQDQATYRTFLMYSVQMQLNAERYMKGATTERERLLLGNANISPQDTAETVRRKADLLTTKAQFDRKAARAFNAVKKNMTAEEFLESDEYMNLYDKYYEDISSIATGIMSYQNAASPAPAPAAPAVAPVAPPAAPPAAAPVVPAAVRPAAPNPAKASSAGQPSVGFIRGPDGVIRRKKAGE